MSFSSQKGEFDRFFNRLHRPVEESRPDRQPDRPVDPTGASRPDRCQSTRPVSISELQYTYNDVKRTGTLFAQYKQPKYRDLSTNNTRRY